MKTTNKPTLTVEDYSLIKDSEKKGPNSYVKARTKLITEFIRLAKAEYPNKEDKDLINGAIFLTTELEIAPENKENREFVDDLLGFLEYADMKNIIRGSVLVTFYHDLGEFKKNRHQSWFCPRSSGYKKYLNY